jgi:hypothetical protein
MPTDFEELSHAVTNWVGVGGKAVRLYQPEGFCNTMSKYWITLRELGYTGEESILYFSNGQDLGYGTNQDFGKRFGFRDSIQRQLHKDQKKHSSHYRIPGMTPTLVGQRTMGRGNIQSRNDLLNLIIDNPGIYLYGVDARPGAFEAGHAMAFDTRRFADNRILYFMDPNWGLFWHDDAGDDAEAAFRELYRRYWQCDYKRSKHSGGRDLYRYTGADRTAFSSLVMRPFRKK